jgi:hypothetical protein
VEELRSLRRRVNRQHALDRIHPEDHETLLKLINDLEAFIIDKLREREDGEDGYY